jgi:hypothetical protein
MVSSSSPALGRRKEFVLCIAIEIEERCGVVRRGNARGLQNVRVGEGKGRKGSKG